VKAAVEEYYLNSLSSECIEVMKELVHPLGMGDAMKVSEAVSERVSEEIEIDEGVGWGDRRSRGKGREGKRREGGKGFIAWEMLWRWDHFLLVTSKPHNSIPPSLLVCVCVIWFEGSNDDCLRIRGILLEVHYGTIRTLSEWEREWVSEEIEIDEGVEWGDRRSRGKGREGKGEKDWRIWR
jgi:hypothetical protein